MTARSKKRAAIFTLGVILLGGVLWQFPLFHIVRVSEPGATRQDQSFDAATVAETLWNGPLRDSFNDAANAAAIVTAIRDNPQVAREEFGRTVGLSRAYYFYLQGHGTIVSIDSKSVGVALDENGKPSESSSPDLALHTGLLFGNTVRDATGLVRASDYANSQYFNEISTQLNRLVETEVLPRLRKNADVGDRIQFIGCAEIVREARDLKPPLKVIPIHVKLETNHDVETSR